MYHGYHFVYLHSVISIHFLWNFCKKLYLKIKKRIFLKASTNYFKGPSTLATLFNHMWPRIVAGIFIPVGNHYFQALASTLQFVAQVCDRLWLVPATDRAFAYITYMSPPHVALVCSGPPQCAATYVVEQSGQCARSQKDVSNYSSRRFIHHSEYYFL